MVLPRALLFISSQETIAMAYFSQPYPLLCTPALKSRIWGGTKLKDLYGIALPAGEKTGEAWIAADLKEGASGIANGPLRGRTLSEAAALWGEDLIGPAWRGRPTGQRFPLLIKLLDAQDDLSVQVHPDEAACRNHFPNDFSKDESWIVMHAEPGSRILCGFRPGVSLADFDRALREGGVEELLQSVAVQPGQVFRVAPRTVHALCRGVVILEIQEPSDTTFRIYDYGRLGDDGKPRQLHLEQARKVMRFDGAGSEPIRPHFRELPWGWHELLVDAPAYRIERLAVQEPMAWDVNPASAQVVIVTDGGLALRGSGMELNMHPGACAILPATMGRAELQPAGKAQCILAGAGGVAMVGA